MANGQQRVGIIGLGTLGMAVARLLVDRGYDVMVWNRSAGPVANLVAAGATAAASVDDSIHSTHGVESARRYDVTRSS